MKIFKNFFQNFIQNRWRSNTPTSPVGMGWGYVGGGYGGICGNV